MVLGYAGSSGAVLLDPTLPVIDVHASVSSLAPGYGHTFAIGGIQALFTAVLPYSWAWLSGKVGPTAFDSSITRAGVGDLKVKFSANFIGSPALTPMEFAKTPPKRLIVGASFAIVAPTGQYLPEKLINIGTNRWAFKPEIGVSYNWNAKLYVDFYTGVWLFATNRAFAPGTSSRTQDPLVSLQLHSSYTFMPRFWLAVDGTWYNGGATQVNGGSSSTRQSNARLGAILSYGFTGRQSVKASWSYGASSRTGSDFTTFGLAYQLLWF